jgi:hypothetical protein
VVVVVVVVMAIAVVIVIVPVAVSVPAMVVFIPPFVSVGPAILARFAEVVAGAFGLFAVPSVMFGGFVDAMVGASHAVLAFAFIGAESGCAYEEKRCGQDGDGEESSSPE